MAVILRVLISFSSVVTALNFDFRKASVIRAITVAQHTTETGDGKPVKRPVYSTTTTQRQLKSAW